MHAQLGHIMDQETFPASSEEPQTNTGCGEHKQKQHMPPKLNTTYGWANHLRHPSCLTPGHTPTLTLPKETALPTL